MTIRGGQFGVDFEPRGSNDPHVCVRILTEDDEHWSASNVSFSSYWLDDFIAVLQAAKAALGATTFEPDGRFGYRWKPKAENEA